MSSGLLVDLLLRQTYCEKITRQSVCRKSSFGLCDGIFSLRRFYRHCKVVLTGDSGVVILQTGSSF